MSPLAPMPARQWIHRPFSERKISITIVENNFGFDYIISQSLLDPMEAMKKTFIL